MTSHNKGSKHLENVFNAEIIYQKDDVTISRKAYKALETKEQWLSDSVRFFRTFRNI